MYWKFIREGASLSAMFTGLVQDIGIVRAVERHGEDMSAEIETGLRLENMSIGASICCAGVCLSVTDKAEKSFFVDISAETLSKTSLVQWAVGRRINLEPSLRLGDELGGHFVFGHVDGLARVEAFEASGGSLFIRLKAPDGLERFIAAKGSVTLDGVSLTVNRVEGIFFEVNIIPHTAENTTLSNLSQGDFLNMEVDMLARYVAKMVGQPG